MNQARSQSIVMDGYGARASAIKYVMYKGRWYTHYKY